MMNKYQKALNTLRKEYLNNESKECDLLQELVDKTVPKKPVLGEIWEDDYTTIYDEDGFIIASVCVCPNCGKYTIYDWEYGVKFKHCTNCMQAIDWSDKDE